MLLKPIDSSHKVLSSFFSSFFPSLHPIDIPFILHYKTLSEPSAYHSFSCMYTFFLFFFTFLIRSFHFSPLICSSAILSLLTFLHFRSCFLFCPTLPRPPLSYLRYSVPYTGLSPSKFPSIPTLCKAFLRICRNERP